MANYEHLKFVYDDLKDIIARDDNCSQQLDNKLIAVISLDTAIITLIATLSNDLLHFSSLALLPIVASFIVALIAYWPRKFGYYPSNDKLIKYIKLLSNEEKDYTHDYLYSILDVADHCKLCETLEKNFKLVKHKSNSVTTSLITMIIGVLCYAILMIVL